MYSEQQYCIGLHVVCRGDIRFATTTQERIGQRFCSGNTPQTDDDVTRQVDNLRQFRCRNRILIWDNEAILIAMTG